MTRVTIKEEYIRSCRLGNRYEIEITGHVLRREPEKNDACVAASILAQTMVQTFRNHEDKFWFYDDVVDDDAHVYMMVVARRESDGFARSVIETIYTGFKMLKENFPDDFEIEYGIGGA